MGLNTALAASVKGKAAAAVLAALLATGTASGAVVAANQGAFGQQVKAQVATCKKDLAQGVHGIGHCVSAFARRHGAQERLRHSKNHAGGTHGQPRGSHGNSGHHGGPPSGTPGASNGKAAGKP